MTTRATQIANPGRFHAEHGNEITFTIYVNHRERERDHAARVSSYDLQSNQVIWGNAKGVHNCPASVDHTPKEIGMSPAVKPAFKVIWQQSELRFHDQ